MACQWSGKCMSFRPLPLLCLSNCLYQFYISHLKRQGFLTKMHSASHLLQPYPRSQRAFFIILSSLTCLRNVITSGELRILRHFSGLFLSLILHASTVSNSRRAVDTNNTHKLVSIIVTRHLRSWSFHSVHQVLFDPGLWRSWAHLISRFTSSYGK